MLPLPKNINQKSLRITLLFNFASTNSSAAVNSLEVSPEKNNFKSYKT